MGETRTKDFLHRITHALKLDLLPKGVRRLIVGMVGGTVLLFGFALIFLPGPAIVVIPLGLAILATEFAWARRYLHKGKRLWEKARRKPASSKSTRAPTREISARE